MIEKLAKHGCSTTLKLNQMINGKNIMKIGTVIESVMILAAFVLPLIVGCGVSDQEIVFGVVVVFIIIAVASLFNSVLFGMYRDKQEFLKPKTGIRKRINGEWVTEWSESK